MPAAPWTARISSTPGAGISGPVFQWSTKTMKNGTITTRPTPTIERYDPRADLDAWDDAITALDAALTDAAHARAIIEAETETLDRLQAAYVLAIDGGNAESRKARLTLALAGDARYEQHRQAHTTARRELLDAERRVQVMRERCRLLRAVLALAGSTTA
jgi:hypothetical protein